MTPGRFYREIMEGFMMVVMLVVRRNGFDEGSCEGINDEDNSYHSNECLTNGNADTDDYYNIHVNDNDYQRG